MIKAIGMFFAGLFSNSDSPSFGRFAAFVALLAVIAWVSIIVWRTNTIPEMAGCILLVSTLYAITKSTGVIDSIKAKAGEPPPAQQ